MQRAGRRGGWFGVVFGVGAFAGTAMGRCIFSLDLEHGEEITIATAVVIACVGFAQVIRSGTAGHRTRFMMLVSIASVYAALAMLDANTNRWPEARGQARSLVALEGRFLGAARAETTHLGRRDSIPDTSHVVMLQVDSKTLGDGSIMPLPVGTEIEVRIASGSMPDLPGVKVALVGTLRPAGRSPNPGAPRDIRSSSGASILVPDARLIRPVVDANRGIDVNWMMAIRSEIRDRFRRGIDAMVSCSDGASDEESLLWCLLTGDRDRLDDRTRSAFQRSGVSHLLAISGLHLAVVTSIPWFILGWIGVGRLIRCTVTAMFVIGGVLLVESSPSVVRAASMIVPALTATAIGAAFGVIPLLGIVAGCMLWSDPGWVDSVGFQLSFVATSALAFSCGGARASWFGHRDSIGRSRRGIIHDRWATMATASTVACLATLPIVEARFGVVPLYLIPANIMIAPLMLILLMLIVPASIIAMVDPVFGHAIARPVNGLERLLREIVIDVADVSPVILTLDPGGIWTLLATMLGVTIPGLSVHRGIRRIAASTFLAMVLIPMLPSAGTSTDVRLRVDMLAVGDGTAILVRTPRSTVLFDAGSSSISGFGAQTMFRGLRSLGVRHLDGIVVSHANIDHHGAIPDLVRLVPTDSIVVTPAFLRRIHGAPDTTDHSRLLEAIARTKHLRIVNRMDRLAFPDGDWLVLHPDVTDRFRRINDESISLQIHGPSVTSRGEQRIADLLLLGDLETAGAIRLMRRTPTLRARVMEIPHHGSWRPVVVELIESVDPTIMLQSTGPRRFETDRFDLAARCRVRLVTCRDGAGAVTVSRDGSMTVATTGSGIRARIRSSSVR